jgi:hypothetical protein
LHHAAAVAVGPGQFPHEGTEPWSVACGMFGRHLGLGPTATLHTPALMQHPVRHLHRDGRQFKHLMRVVRPKQGQRRVPTRTLLGPHLVHGRG